MSKKDTLEAFLSADLNATKKVKLDRLGIEAEVKGLSAVDVNRLREQATFGDRIDEHLLDALLITKSCVNIDFGDQKMLSHFDATDSADCVQKALLAGEVVKLSQAVMSASGFDDLADQVDAAKN